MVIAISVDKTILTDLVPHFHFSQYMHRKRQFGDPRRARFFIFQVEMGRRLVAELNLFPKVIPVLIHQVGLKATHKVDVLNRGIGMGG